MTLTEELVRLARGTTQLTSGARRSEEHPTARLGCCRLGLAQRDVGVELGRVAIATQAAPPGRISAVVRLRRRRYRGFQPVAYPAWRLWEDRRVRTDEGIFGLLFAVRIAQVGLSERAASRPPAAHVSD